MTQTLSFIRFGVSCIFLGLLSLACSSAFGIEEAHFDPSVDADQSKEAKSKQPVGAGECKPFDNKRLKHLQADGALTPLPGR